MKKLIFYLFAVLASISVNAQTVNVHLKDGQAIRYNSTEVDYVDFSEESVVPTPVPTPVPTIGNPVITFSLNIINRSGKDVTLDGTVEFLLGNPDHNGTYLGWEGSYNYTDPIRFSSSPVTLAAGETKSFYGLTWRDEETGSGMGEKSPFDPSQWATPTSNRNVKLYVGGSDEVAVCDNLDPNIIFKEGWFYTIVISSVKDPTPANPPTEETTPHALTDKHITKVEFLTESDGVERLSYECIISYDSEGRVSSFIWRDGDDEYNYSQYKYIYGENRIFEDRGSGTTTFSLLNGRVTSAEDYSFSYDSSGHLQTKEGETGITYTWKNDNLVSYSIIGKSSARKVDLEYSDIRVPVNFIPHLLYRGYKSKFYYHYPFLSYYGFFGKGSQNLAKKLVETFAGGGTPSSVTEEYDYTMEDGLPIEIKVKSTSITYEESTINKRIIIEWN